MIMNTKYVGRVYRISSSDAPFVFIFTSAKRHNMTLINIISVQFVGEKKLNNEYKGFQFILKSAIIFYEIKEGLFYGDNYYKEIKL